MRDQLSEEEKHRLAANHAMVTWAEEYAQDPVSGEFCVYEYRARLLSYKKVIHGDVYELFKDMFCDLHCDIIERSPRSFLQSYVRLG